MSASRRLLVPRNVSFAPQLGIKGLVMSLSSTSNTRAETVYPCTIRHDSLFKAVWDWLILALVIFTAIEIPYSVAFLIPLQPAEENPKFLKVNALLVFNLLVDLMFIMDILINFRTTFVNITTDEVISNPRQIALHYLKTWFVVDFVAAIPFEFMVLNEVERLDSATTLFGLLKAARLLRLVRVARKLDRYSEYGTAVVVLLTCLFTLIAHWLACIWHGIGYEERENKFSWINELSRQLNQHDPATNSTQSPSLTTRYITALYFTLSSLTSVGFGNVSPNTDAEKIFSVCVMIIGALMYASIFGNLTAIIQRLYSRTSRFHRDLKVIEDFVRFYKIPKTTKEELDEYFRHEWAYTKGVDIDAVLKRFPESLQADVCLHLHRNLFEECKVFKSASEGCLRALALRFKIRHYLPGHFIIKQGDEVKRLYFIAKGNIDVVKYDDTMLTLGKGDIISCDYSTVQSTNLPQANSSLRVQTHGEIHSVAWNELIGVLRAYPSFREEFISHLELAYNLGTEAEGEEVFLFPNDAQFPSPRLSNARSTFSSRFTMDRLERSGSPTLFVNGKIPQVPNSSEADLRSGKNGGGMEPRINVQTASVNPANPTVASVAQVNCSHATEFVFIEKRLAQLETRLSAMEERLTGNFETILHYLRPKGRSAPELRDTII
ncbi:potassium voltage-gated channel subfamily H member 6-like isoform X1 [Montipora foliosa]|uniref:potassium voltage-gated channel subfamily H member 6-like isoform X1 n=2 Tax=Montipora foliosa TaxID=591990 RepID=UPI0035F1B247